jgi:hypothetical protein
MVCLLAMPIGALGAGALADGWAITLMSKTGEWQSRLAPLLGTGKVGGLSLLFAVAGLLYVLLASLGLAFGPLRRLQPGVPLYGETRRGAGLTAAGSGDVLAGAPRLEEQG